jgi:DNA repair exonuclease SbcCD ATPase subunit
MLRYQPTTDHHHETVVMEKSEDRNQQDWIAEPEIDQQTQVNLEFQQLLKLNTELSTANNDLYAQVEQLKTELAEAEKILHWQKTRSSVSESMFKQQSQELSAAQEQIQSLYEQLETSVQTVQRQELCIETYKSNLQISQQRLAHLERECSLLQTNYTEESQQLLHSENTCRELRTRLMRQQRQTLQFKTALEKCLDTPIPNHENLEDHIHHPHDVIQRQTRFSRKARSLFTNAQPIRPWSEEADSVNESVNNSWVKPTVTPDENYTHHQEPLILQPIEVHEPIIESIKVDNSEVSPLDEKLEGIIHKFFTPPSPSTTLQEVETKVNIHQGDTSVVENLAYLADNYQQPEISIKENLPLEIDPYGTVENPGKEDFNLSLTQELPMISSSLKHQSNSLEMEDYWLDVSSEIGSNLPTNDILPESFDENISDHKSPSPLIYPQRPPKGRKSLASVELPNFQPKHK